jgi:hypothetical protein
MIKEYAEFIELCASHGLMIIIDDNHEFTFRTTCLGSGSLSQDDLAIKCTDLANSVCGLQCKGNKLELAKRQELKK